MKLLGKAILLLLFAMCLPEACSQDPAVTEAINILKTTKAMYEPWGEINQVNPDKKKAARILFDKQIRAINVLGKAKVDGTAELVVPFLNYNSNEYAFIGGYNQPPHPSLEQTRNQWPAFSALIELPGAAKALSNCALDKNEDFRYRVAALAALRYVDKIQCAKIAPILIDQATTSRQKLYIHGVNDGTIPFQGVYFFPPYIE